MNKKAILILFFIGVLYRLAMILLIPQPFEFDQVQYHDFAMGILKHGIYAHTFRLFGYPMLIAAIYFITGIVSQLSKLPWQIFQAFLDTVTALLVLLISQRIFRDNKPVFLAYIICLFNPFTPPYTGVMLTEILTTFILTLICYLFLILFEKKQRYLLFTLSFLLGYLPQVRPVFLLFSFLMMLYLTIKATKEWIIRRKISTVIVCFLLFFLPFVYNVAGNLIFFRQFSATTVDNVFIENLYMSLYLEKVPRRDTSIFSLPEEVREAYNEFSFTKSKEERILMSQKYTDLTLSGIRNQPIKFVRWRLVKLWSIWEKNSIFVYRGPDENLAQVIYFGNLSLLVLSFAGFALWFRTIKKDGRFSFLFAGFVIFLFLYITFCHTISFADGRFSIPFYPVIYLFSGFALWKLNKIGKSH